MNNHNCWDPDLYLRFRKERTQAAVDLAVRIELEYPDCILDLGCGPGNSTQILRKKYPNANITGIDNSPEMIEKAQAGYPEGKWILADAANLGNYGFFDIVFSNAVLQWLPDHEKLVPELFRLVRPEGILAVQVPQNRQSSLHKALFMLSGEEPFKPYTENSLNQLNYRDIIYYYSILSMLTPNISLWETTYYHVLSEHRDIIDWYKSTGMRPCLEKLPSEELRGMFIERMLEHCIHEYPIQANGTVIFPFNRLFFIAKKLSG